MKQMNQQWRERAAALKSLACAILTTSAAIAAFADGDDNVTVLVSTKGPDCYQGGGTVLDGECYALVWSSDGVFDGFTADGSPVDENDRIVNVGAVARDGRCRAAFEVTASLAAALKDGVYAVYLLDTRVDENGAVAPKGLVDGRLAVLNGYGEVADGVSVSVSVGCVVAKETEPKDGAHDGKRVNAVADPASDVRQPRIVRIDPEDDGLVLYVENLKGYMRVRTGKDLSLSDDVTPAVRTDGSDRDVRIVVPKDGAAGFYKVIRN